MILLFPVPPPPLPSLRLLALIIDNCQLPERLLLDKLGVVCPHHHPIPDHGRSLPQKREELLPRVTLRAQMIIWKLPNVQFLPFLTFFPNVRTLI